jgi:hypothetical protein
MKQDGWDDKLWAIVTNSQSLENLHPSKDMEFLIG